MEWISFVDWSTVITERGNDMMSLSKKIECAKNKAESISKFANAENKEFVWNYSFRADLEKIVNDDLMYNNPDNLFEEYKEYFKTIILHTKVIDRDAVFYRGRVGNELLYGADDDLNRSFVLPYYQHNIEAPPPIYTNGGRFNRQGISYLYLADSVETCLTEVHLQIGQNCSVGECMCKEKMEVIDLTRFEDIAVMKAWLKILMQPVHDGTEHIYNKTRFLADIFKSINSNGIYFESVQAEGQNIVCYDPSLFQCIEYSEKIYTATKIKYAYQQVEDSIQEYSKNGKKSI